jgi:nucleoid DNA-binding protein
MKKLSKILNKRKLSFIIAKKLNHTIHHIHIANIISLFVDEFMNQLEQKEKINVPNFCTFKLETNKPRRFYNIKKRRFAVSTGTLRMKVKLSRSLRNRIIQNMDLMKTFL